MADKSGIEWTDATWNPVRGCTRVSEGCRNCYAERFASRIDFARYLTSEVTGLPPLDWLIVGGELESERAVREAVRRWIREMKEILGITA